MAEIAVGPNPAWTIPAMDFAGVPTGIDIRLVVETGLAPTINTGIAHREPGVGQVGAGIVKAPLKCFEQALVAFAADDGRRMSVIVNEVRRATYLDSIVLMRIVARDRRLAGSRGGGPDDRHAGEQGHPARCRHSRARGRAAPSRAT